jgi:hypothetical protein
MNSKQLFESIVAKLNLLVDMEKSHESHYYLRSQVFIFVYK